MGEKEDRFLKRDVLLEAKQTSCQLKNDTKIMKFSIIQKVQIITIIQLNTLSNKIIFIFSNLNNCE